VSRRDHDIKAPDGYLLGGLRRVLKDRTILFQRGYWGPVPAEWVGERVWVHEDHDLSWPHGSYLDVAPPGVHIYAARVDGGNVRADRTERPDAKPGLRNPVRKAWSARMRGLPPTSAEPDDRAERVGEGPVRDALNPPQEDQSNV
jgi:hypothetical protein